LLKYTITYLSLLNNQTTLRELHRKIKENKNISLITLMEYMDFLLNSKLIKRVYNYDFKKQKIIKTKAKYYFSDL
jgi:predicted AAA+ superfamily ATPase